MRGLYVGRHGHVDTNRSLSSEGIDDAHSMAERLRDWGILHQGVVLSSLADRALRTAGIIKDDLGIPTLIRSEFIGKVGEHPEPVEDLRGFIGDILATCAISHTDLDIVVITHQPLVKAIAGTETTYGQIYPVPEDWKNPAFNPDFAICLEQPELW